ncbi:6866_t:CDS:2 [Acaulospora colombiana]|uniref:6866_t:CDS:1 n=1 Tax=Acaulospora colombiana TaxID=27376 RepID=A0ACA9M154_9GLOM|nr:6866_t:CDS:2 [Acaulospora colombiana]
MWELASGYQPYHNIEHDENLIVEICNGLRPEITNDTPECWRNLMSRCWDPEPSSRPKIEEIMKMSDDDEKIFCQQFKEAEEKRQKMIEYGTLFAKGYGSNNPNSIYHSRLLSPLIEAARSILNSRNPDVTRSLEVDKNQHDSSITESKNFDDDDYRTEICSDCHNRGKLANAVCEICYFKNFNLKVSGNKDIDDFLRELMRGHRPTLEWIPYEEFSGVEKIGQGELSKVYMATWHKGPINENSKSFMRKSSIKVALKVLNESQNLDSKFFKKLKFSGWSANDFYGISREPTSGNYIFVMEYAKLGNLNIYLQTNFNKITWIKKKMILNNIVGKIGSIHGKGIIHQNLHSGNILARSPKRVFGKVWISDLGFNQAINKKSEYPEVYGVIPYVAPEYEEAEKRRLQMVMTDVKEAEPNHPTSAYHARLLNPIMDSANIILNSRSSSNIMHPSASPSSPEIQVEPQRPRNIPCNKYQLNISKSGNKDIDDFLKKSLGNEGRCILEWIPYGEFSNLEKIGRGGFSKM